MQHPRPESAVIDTNVVLDCFVFRDASATPLVELIVTGGLLWLATDAMRAELEHVLTRSTLQRWHSQRHHALAGWDRWARPVPAFEPLAAAQRLVCPDPDDQKFIDLAIATRSCWLFTRDRALLSLARQARRLGVDVLTPSIWSAGRRASAAPA
jgi:putative PIN family toxin of toxin-antitoxin system